MYSMISKCAVAAAGLGLLALAGSAGAQQDFVRNTDATTRACFDTSKLRGYAPDKVDGRDAVNLRSDPGGVYQMEFATPCLDIGLARGLSVRSKTGSRYICNGAEADVTVVGGHDRQIQCKVSGLRKLSDAEVAALAQPNRP